MSIDYSRSLNAEKALIWRIVHRANIPWILDHGLYAVNGGASCANWIPIGNAELITKRATHKVPIVPFGVLNDYIPFYFTPFSPMLKNIHSGYAGITKRANQDIVILVSSAHKLLEKDVPFVFTDAHAYYHLNVIKRKLWYIEIVQLMPC
jgi:hypothetical protein